MLTGDVILTPCFTEEDAPSDGGCCIGVDFVVTSVPDVLFEEDGIVGNCGNAFSGAVCPYTLLIHAIETIIPNTVINLEGCTIVEANFN